MTTATVDHLAKILRAERLFDEEAEHPRQDADLKPREIALLVALRAAPINLHQIAYAIGEYEPTPVPVETRLLVDRCTDAGLVRTVAETGVVYPLVRLTSAGVAWLQLHGLDARYPP